MNHITQEHAVALAKKTSMKDIMWVHELCNAAIEHYIAQQAASVDATFKKWNTPILDKYAPKQIGNVDSVCTSQERVYETAKSEQVPLTDEEVQALAICREDGRVSVSKIQRKLCVGYSHAHVICQSIIDKGQCGGLLISPQLTTFGIKEPKV